MIGRSNTLNGDFFTPVNAVSIFFFFFYGFVFGEVPEVSYFDRITGTVRASV